MSRLDWTDKEAVGLWLYGLRESLSDYDAAASDLLRPLRKRQLGHATHTAIMRAARAQIRMALDYANPEPEPPFKPGPGDPAGCGGAGPVA